MTSSFECDVFISYNSADEEISRKIGSLLEQEPIGERKIKVFFAPWDIKKGENFITKIDEGLEKAKYFVLVLSPEALDAEWPTAERAAALLTDPSGRLGRVIPILVKSCKLPSLLAIRNWVDIREKSNFKTEIQKLIYTIKGEPLPRGNLNFEYGKQTIVESGPSNLFRLNNASNPDNIDEKLHSNLYPVINIPRVIWKSPTRFWEKRAVYSQLGNKIPAFILRENHLFTFSSLNDLKNPLRFIIDVNNIESIKSEKWFSDEDKARWLVDLLGSETRKFCKNLGLYFDVTSKQFYGDMKVISNEALSWTAHVRTSKRSLIIPYVKDDKKTGIPTTYFYRHRAIGLRFLLLGKELFLQIDPGWEYSKDGSILIEGRRRSILNTRLRSMVKNDVEFDEMRFWAWLISDGKKIIMGSDDAKIEIDSKPLTFETSGGIYGDKKIIPDMITEPPPLVEEDDEMEEFEVNSEVIEEGEDDDI